MSITSSIPKGTVVLPSNVRASELGGKLILTKVKRSRKRFKMSKAQRQKISAASRKFKVPILTSLAVAPAVLISLNQAMTKTGMQTQFFTFARHLISFYTGVLVDAGGGVTFDAAKLAVGWGPLVAIGLTKSIAKGRVMAINRALSRAQIPANLS